MKRVAKASDKQTTARTTEPVTNARNGSLRLRIVEPAIKDPAARRRGIDRATSRIKTSARIDTVAGE
jgi:hypothetical protein